MRKAETGKKWTRRGVTLAFSVYFIYRKCPSFVLFLISSSPVIAVALFFLWIIMYSDRKSNGRQLHSSDDMEDLLSNSSLSSSSEEEEVEHEDYNRGDSESARRLEWTADDEKNMRLVGSSELERNLRLEHLIEKRRSRNYQRSQTFINLIDSDLLLTPTTTDHHHHHQQPNGNSDEEGEEEETENSKTEVVKKHWMNVRCRLSYGMKQMLASEEHGVESISSGDSTTDEEDDDDDDDDDDYVDEDQITEPVFESSKLLKEALHYLNNESTRSYNSLASDMQVEISECGSPTKHHLRKHHGTGVEDGNTSWVASPNLAMVDQFESRTRELNEISERDVFQKLSSTEGDEEEEDDDITPPPIRGGGEKSNRNQEHASFLNRSFMVNRSVMRDLDISDLDFQVQPMTKSLDSQDVLHRRSKSTNL